MKRKLPISSIHSRFGLTSMAIIFAFACSIAHADTNLVRVGTQFVLAYLPLVVMEHDHLWEKQADARGVTLRVEYARLGGGAGFNDALLSGSVELVAGGLAPMLLLWDRTSSSDKVTGVAALNVSPMDILTNKPGVKSLADFTADDRIVVPAIKVSIQAIALEAATEKAFGPGQGHRLDTLTVTMQHPDALIALTAHSSQITAYVSSSPFQEIALKSPGISKVTDSFDAFGGPATFSVVYAKKRFGTDNPVVMAAFYAALREAIALIASQRAAVIDEYLEVTREKTDRAVIEDILRRPDFTFGMEPVGTLAVANLMHHFGLLRQTPTSWRDYIADPLHSAQGS